MLFTHTINRLPQGARLRLYARMPSACAGAWRRVGSATREGGTLAVSFEGEGQLCAPAWTLACDPACPGAEAGPTLEFGVGDGRGIALVARCPITRAVSAESRVIGRAMGDSSPRPGRGLGGGPSGLRSSWPDASRLCGVRR
jgi:hypothetical protein